MVLLVSNKAGFFPILVFFATGFQGITGSGIQEEGINTGTGPAIFQFIGLAGDLHCPKAGIFKKGIISNLLAKGLAILVVVLFKGNTTMDFGPEPNEHLIFAPLQTHFGIINFLMSLFNQNKLNKRQCNISKMMIATDGSNYRNIYLIKITTLKLI